MPESPLVLGIDLGTSGVRIALININSELIYYSSSQYSIGLQKCEDWENSCRELIKNIPSKKKERIIACSIDGTSGTLMGCDYNGKSLGDALPYFDSCIAEQNAIQKKYKNLNLASGFGRASKLINKFGDEILLRHQADWISGWLLNDWTFGEEGNNLKLGWKIVEGIWPQEIHQLNWRNKLPKILPSGKSFGKIALNRAKELNLPKETEIISGTTDSNASVIATGASLSEGVTVLGSTIVIKSFVKTPINLPGVTTHRVGNRWLCGGASNAGCAVLKRFFNDKNLVELSRQINPESDSGLMFRPLTFQGERFPIDNPYLEPILEPRPVSDSLFLHGILEGLARIEAQGWEKFKSMNVEIPKKIITIGGGAGNPQWRRIRERLIGIPIRTCSKQAAEGVARLALQSLTR